MFNIIAALHLGDAVRLSLTSLGMWREAGVFALKKAIAQKTIRDPQSGWKFVPLNAGEQLSIRQMLCARPLDDIKNDSVIRQS